MSLQVKCVNNTHYVYTPHIHPKFTPQIYTYAIGISVAYKIVPFMHGGDILYTNQLYHIPTVGLHLLHTVHDICLGQSNVCVYIHAHTHTHTQYIYTVHIHIYSTYTVVSVIYTVAITV